MIDLTTLTDGDRVRLLQQELSVIEELGAQLSDEDWDRESDLPGWTVKDNLSHLIDFENAAIGREHAPTDIDVSAYEHLTNDFQRANERGVELRRGRPGKEVLSEWAEIAPIRAKQLETLDLSEEMPASATPLGIQGPLRDMLMIRLLDLFYHEQDIRRAVGKPGHLNGDVARTVFARMATLAIPRVVSKAANASEGSVVVFNITDAESFAVRTQEGKGALTEPTSDAILTFTLDIETFFCLLGGRRTPDAWRADGRVQIQGDEELAARILQHIAVVP